MRGKGVYYLPDAKNEQHAGSRNLKVEGEKRGEKSGVRFRTFNSREKEDGEQRSKVLFQQHAKWRENKNNGGGKKRGNRGKREGKGWNSTFRRAPSPSKKKKKKRRNDRPLPIILFRRSNPAFS